MLGSTGGLLEFRAALLASHGYAALALAYTSYDGLPDFYHLELDYFDVCELRRDALFASCNKLIKKKNVNVDLE